MAVTTGQGLRLVAARRKVAELASKWPAKRINAILYGTVQFREKCDVYDLTVSVQRKCVLIFYFVRGYSFRDGVFCISDGTVLKYS